jgi:hypothetical protein
MRDVEVRCFMLAYHASGINKGVLVAQVVSSEACLLLRIREGELNRFLEMAYVGDRNLKAVFGGFDRGKGNIDCGIDLGGLFGGGLGEGEGREEEKENDK